MIGDKLIVYAVLMKKTGTLTFLPMPQFLTSKVRLSERSERQSEPFVGQARPNPAADFYIENIFSDF